VDHTSYYPGARKIWIKLIVEREGRKLIGAQAAGYGEVAKRIDVAATAISAGMRIDDIAQLDLAYSPPFSSLWDPLLIAAQAVMRELDS
jgi:CoA-dependent NAD(P)H sulfur oxidoreductase